MKLFNKIKFNKKIKGSSTVEAAMIFPLIMFVLMAIIYLTIVHYQNNVMIVESIRAMNRAGAYWQYIDMDKTGEIIEYNEQNIPTAFDNSIPKDGLINIEMIRKRNAYRTVMDVVSEVISKILNKTIGKKKGNAKKYVTSRLANVKFKQYTTDADTKIGEIKGEGFMIFGNDLSIEIEKAYTINPLLGLSRTFLGQNNVMENLMKKNIIVSSVISNQAEFVRNFDTIYDLTSDTYNYVKSK